MSGPPPKDASLRRRRNPTPGFKLLPHEGRTGPAPDWPLAGGAANDEQRLWVKLWALPQAVEWERMRCEEIVALYTKVFVDAASSPDPKLLAEARQLDTKIGLSPKAMRDLHWETDEPLDDGEDLLPDPGKPETIGRTYVPKKPGGDQT